MTPCGEPLQTSGKHQSDSERRHGIANETGELVPNRRHHLAESCFSRASTASLPETASERRNGRTSKQTVQIVTC